MKKLLLTLIASSCATLAFASTAAPTTEAVAFDSTKMKCGEHTITAKDSVDSLTDMCQGFKFGKGKSGFLDQNSGKKVVCAVKKGKLDLASCQVAPQK